MKQRVFDILQRGKAWKAYVERTLLLLSAEHTRLREGYAQLRIEVDRLAREARSWNSQFGGLVLLQARDFHQETIAPLGEALPHIAALGENYMALCARRSSQLLVLLMAPDDKRRAELAGDSPDDLRQAFLDGVITELLLIVPNAAEGFTCQRNDTLLAAINRTPLEAAAWLALHQPPKSEDPKARSDYFSTLSSLVKDLSLLDFNARADAQQHGAQPPFDAPETLPRLTYAEPRKNSALFLHNHYYHFNNLGDGLRRRDWDVVTVSLAAPDSAQQQFFHGEDVNLFHPDPAEMQRRVRSFFASVPERYGALHFGGMGYPSFFGELTENREDPRIVPWDFLELRRHRTLIGYSPSGCMDGALQSSIRDLTGGLCGRCVWELRPDVCSDARSQAWNRKLDLICDWVGLEWDYATPERIGPKTVYGPVVTALDPERWHPAIEIPEEMQLERQPGELLIYHAVGNYVTRRSGDRDIKGTGAILAAIEQLKAEGLPIRLIFAHDVPSTQVRFLQVQADIVVDQLNYGRYGANAREAMMLGRPTICHLDASQSSQLPQLRPIADVPMLDASESTIVAALRSLLHAPERRLQLGAEARAFAVAWHGADACAERYARVIERLRAGLPPESPDLYPV